MSIDGEMTFNQFFTMLIDIGLDMPKRDASTIFKNLDKDGSGRVS
jgi:Ca2+-binding EF-hand superfamily protein